MTTASTTIRSGAVASPATRWGQLIFGIICMVMIANLQYGWTYFVDPIDAKYHWGRTDIQVAFTIFVALETWLVPVEGWFVDRFGPRVVVSFGVPLGASPGAGALSICDSTRITAPCPNPNHRNAFS